MEQTRKKNFGKWAFRVAVVCVIAALAIVPTVLANKEQDDGNKADILSATVTRGTIDDQIIGGGQLTSEGTYNIKIPENVKLESYLVANGDSVKEGDAVAVVDKVSVMTAISEIQETLTELSSQIKDAGSSSSASTIKTNVAGRVKKIYAQPGDSVEDVMLQYGSLAVISLDDTMGISLQTDVKVAISDTVIVRFEDGTQVSGRVKSNINGSVVVMIDDDLYEIGTPVTVTTTDGTVIGTSTLYVYNAWNVTGYDVTISSVQVKEGKKVSENAAIFKVTKTGNSAEYQRLIDKRQIYEQMMADLFQIYQDGVIKATCDGIISGVDTSGTYMASNEGTTADGTAKLVLLGNEDMASVPVITTTTLPGGTVGKEYSGAQLSATLNGEAATGTWAIAADTLPGGLTYDPNTGAISGTPKKAGDYTLLVSFTYDTGRVEDGKQVYSVVEQSVSLTIQNSAQYVGYVAQVTNAAGNAIQVKGSATPYTISGLDQLPNVDTSSLQLTEEGSYAGDLVAAAGLQTGDYIWLVYENKGESSNLVKVAKIGSNTTPGGNSGGMPSGGMPSGFSGGGMSGGISGYGQQTEGDGLYSREKISIATITSQENMTITINVDELEITRLYVGQEAKITMNSLAGETAVATVKQISNSGENNGGNTKFSVELELEKSSDMLPGMNATAYITLDTKENVLVIPSSALYEQDGKDIVYTGYDEKAGTLTGAKEIEIGAADADYVEVVSGLAEGETVYYEYFENKTATTFTF